MLSVQQHHIRSDHSTRICTIYLYHDPSFNLFLYNGIVYTNTFLPLSILLGCLEFFTLSVQHKFYDLSFSPFLYNSSVYTNTFPPLSVLLEYLEHLPLSVQHGYHDLSSSPILYNSIVYTNTFPPLSVLIKYLDFSAPLNNIFHDLSFSPLAIFSTTALCTPIFFYQSLYYLNILTFLPISVQHHDLSSNPFYTTTLCTSISCCKFL